MSSHAAIVQNLLASLTFVPTEWLTFTVDPDSDELHDEQSIRDEARSWFESLRATVHAVTVRQEDKR